MAYKLGSLFDGLYKITEDGRLYSERSKKYLIPNTDKYGYLYFVVSINGERKTLKSHRLVAESFIPNPDSKPTVNHKNGIRTDNRIENLEWATTKEQSADAAKRQALPRLWANTDYRALGAKRNFGRRKTAVFIGDKMIGIYNSLMEAAKSNHANYAKASECANGKRKTTGGKRFCFV